MFGGIKKLFVGSKPKKPNISSKDKAGGVQSLGQGYLRAPSVSKKQESFLDKALAESQRNASLASRGYQDIMGSAQSPKIGKIGDIPGLDNRAIISDAQRQYQQQTIPGILNAFGNQASGDVKGSSALNQALASSGADLNSSLASQLAQMQLGNNQIMLGNQGLKLNADELRSRNYFANQSGKFGASQGLAALGLGQGSIGGTTPRFGHMGAQQKDLPFLQQAAISGLGAGGGGGALIGGIGGLLKKLFGF